MKKMKILIKEKKCNFFLFKFSKELKIDNFSSSRRASSRSLKVNPNSFFKRKKNPQRVFAKDFSVDSESLDSNFQNIDYEY